MSEGWRGDTECANEHHIPTFSPMGTAKKTVYEELGLWTLALLNGDPTNLSHPDTSFA